MLELHFEDYLAAMRRQRTGSVDALITDPPYGTTDLAWDKKIDWQAFWNEAYRIAREDAVFALFSAQPFTTELINSNRKAFRYELIWAKSTSTGFLSANRRPLRAHENIVVFCRYPGRSTYNPQKSPGKPYTGKAHRKQCGHYGKFNPAVTSNATGDRHPKSWLYVPRDNAGAKSLHPTQKPVELMEFLVRSYTDEGQTVYDPFAGSGSTLVAALRSGRRASGSEKDPVHFRTAATRLDETLQAVAIAA